MTSPFDDVTITPSGKVRLSREQLAAMQEAYNIAVAREKQTRDAMRDVLALFQSGVGNLQKALKVLQELLQD